MDKIMYELVYDKLVRHGYIYVEKSLVSEVIEMVTTEARFKKHVEEKGITITNDMKPFMKFVIDEWKPYSENIV